MTIKKRSFLPISSIKLLSQIIIVGYTGKTSHLYAYQPDGPLLLLLINARAALTCRARSEFAELAATKSFSLLTSKLTAFDL